MNLPWTDLTLPLPAALAAGSGLFLVAWAVRSGLARRARTRRDHDWEEQLRLERLAANQVRAQMAVLTDEGRAAQDHLRASEESGRRLGAELEVQVRALADARNQRDFLELDLARVQANAARLTERIEELAPLAGTVRALDQESKAQHGRATLLTQKLDEVVAQRNQIESERTRAAIQVEALENQLRQAALAAKEEYDRRSRQLETWHAERTRLKAELAEADRRHQTALAVLRETVSGRDEARARIRELELAAQAVQAEHEAAVGALSAQLTRLEPLRRQLEDREQLIRVVAAERDAKHLELEARDRAAVVETDRLGSRLAEAELLLKQAEGRESKIRDLEGRLSKVGRERDQLATTLQRYLTELETQRSETKDRDQRFRVLADEFRDTTVAKDQEIAGLKAHMEGLETQLQERAVSAANQPLSADGPAEATSDDLKRIRGIGPALERVLNDEGVYLFRQIATWTQDDVARIAERLRAFPDRINRDDWITSARTEHVRKYGAEP